MLGKLPALAVFPVASVKSAYILASVPAEFAFIKAHKQDAARPGMSASQSVFSAFWPSKINHSWPSWVTFVFQAQTAF